MPNDALIEANKDFFDEDRLQELLPSGGTSEVLLDKTPGMPLSQFLRMQVTC